MTRVSLKEIRVFPSESLGARRRERRRGYGLCRAHPQGSDGEERPQPLGGGRQPAQGGSAEHRADRRGVDQVVYEKGGLAAFTGSPIFRMSLEDDKTP